MSRRPIVLAITSDQHCGSTVALCPPTISLDDGGEYHASKAQLWLWQNWQDFWARADAKRKALNADLYAVFNGDLTEGEHHGSTQILSGNPAAQAAVVDACMSVPLALSPEKLWFVRGTEAHVGKSACYEERVAKGLKKDKRPVVTEKTTGNASHWHARMEIQGVRLDFAHHGRVGTRPWTKPNVTANLAAEIFYNAAAADMAAYRLPTAPHVAVRSHLHQFVDTHDQHPTRVIQTPAWQLATSYIHRIAPGVIADVGGVLLTIHERKVTVENVLYRAEGTPVWTA